MAKKSDSRKIEHELDRLIDPFRVTDGKDFRLSRVKPGDTRGVESKEQGEIYLREAVALLENLHRSSMR